MTAGDFDIIDDLDAAGYFGEPLERTGSRTRYPLAGSRTARRKQAWYDHCRSQSSPSKRRDPMATVAPERPEIVREPDGLYEVIDGRVVEKPMGAYEVWLAGEVYDLVKQYVRD